MAGDSTVWSTNRPCMRPWTPIDEALEQALIAPTKREQRWQLNQLRGLLLTLRSGDLGLEDCLRRLIRLLRTPMIDR
jgi:hypothetical protein